MIEETDLVEGKCYFLLSYTDRDLFFPSIRTLIYLGKDIESGSSEVKKDLWYFQDAESYVEKGAVKEKPWTSECEIHRIMDKESLFSIYDWDSLVYELSENKKAQDNGEIFNGTA